MLKIAFFAIPAAAQAQSSKTLSEEDRLTITIEAISRIKGNLNENLKLKTVVEQLLPKVRGTAAFVEIVKKFQLKDQNVGLLEVTLKNPANEIGVEATRLIIANNGLALLETTLAGTNISNAIKIVEALGNANEKQAVPLLIPIVNKTASDLALRRQAVRSLAQTQEGATALLKLAKENQLPDDLSFVAATELNSARWSDIKSEAATILPLPQGQNAEALPPISELLKMKGDALNGDRVFNRAQTACATCHRVKNFGGDVGPNLSEIGDKLGKDALLEAILAPSAGISFGYEASQIQLKSGDEAFGIIASETAKEIAVKDAKGIITRYKTSDITHREKLKTSIMPTGLQATMSTQELVDLVAFLSSLKKQ